MGVCLRKQLVVIGVMITYMKKQRKYSSRLIRWFSIFVFIVGAVGCAQHFSSEVIEDPYGFLVAFGTE
jgi:hypothetical protein